ncbi:MAG: hypothetical protein GEU96_18685 [Propionibacteriales bacterium]|nr:hypothetical protein [Propionibacteriales bacterium]
MSRRVSLPGADELFRATTHDEDIAASTEAPTEPATAEPPVPADPLPAEQAVDEAPVADPVADPGPDMGPGRQASGRVRHDEKMTVYVTADELLDIEQARLVLRRSLGGAVDRGRLVRAAVAMALADLDENGDESELSRRLSGT